MQPTNTAGNGINQSKNRDIEDIYIMYNNMYNKCIIYIMQIYFIKKDT